MTFKIIEFDIAALGLDREAFARTMAVGARAALAEVVSSGQGSDQYERIVNGRIGAAEESVEPPGPIIYLFNYLEEATQFGLAYLAARYPVTGPAKGGHYRAAHRLFVNGKVWQGGEIGIDDDIMIVNIQPYARKVHVGAKGFAASKGIYEDARQALKRAYRNVIDVELTFVTLSNGYVLKGHQRVRASASSAKSAAFRAGRQTLSPRKDLQAGVAVTYPALKIRRIDG